MALTTVMINSERSVDVSYLTSRADTTGVLPPIGLSRRLDLTAERREEHLEIFSMSNLVGSAHLVWDEQERKSWFSRVDTVRGYGTSAHLAVAALSHLEGYGFRNDPIGMSKAALDVWLRFVEQRIARIEDPLVHDGSGPYPYVGEAIIPAGV